ncbi:MAG: SDR family oxidoreductase [Chitinophagia bacterium]|nr:SDR family oxidoreductase [Chitinophagia bacterium]
MTQPIPFEGQTAIVTGASSGIGFAIAEALAKQGVAVFNFDKTPPPEPLQRVGWRQVDITDEDSVRIAVDGILEERGAIHILVNSAGITGLTNRKSHETDTGDVRRVMDVNFFGSYLTSKQVLPVMTGQGYGRILHIASIAGKEGNAGMLAYSASKAAVIALAKVQGKEYAETGVTVNALAPAVIRTPLVDGLPDVQVDYMTSKIPMRRCGTLQEVAEMALFIVSPQNSFTTGFTFDLSGGRATY